jgi:integrase/recombinase XerD
MSQDYGRSLSPGRRYSHADSRRPYYLSVRRATGFRLREAGYHLRSFAAYSDAKDRHFVNSQTAIEWARQVPSVRQRARRLGDVIRFAKYLHAEDARHEIPTTVFGSEHRPRRPPYILSDEQICRLVQLAAQSGYRTLRRQTYSTLFALLSQRRSRRRIASFISSGEPVRYHWVSATWT